MNRSLLKKAFFVDTVLQVRERSDLEITAYHEAGHTLVAYFTDDTMPIHKVEVVDVVVDAVLVVFWYCSFKQIYNLFDFTLNRICLSFRNTDTDPDQNNTQGSSRIQTELPFYSCEACVRF